MIGNISLLALVLYFLTIDYGYASKHIPVFSDTYVVKGILSMPYAELKEPFTAWYDNQQQRSRIDYYDGMVKMYQLGKKHKYGIFFEVVPVTTEKKSNFDTCFHWIAKSAKERVTAQPALPDLKSFKLAGHEKVDGFHCDVWRFIHVQEQKINNYTLFLRWKETENKKKIPIPVLYEMNGYDTLYGSHIDHYYIHYKSYSTETPSESLFDVPHHLKCKTSLQKAMNPMQEFIHNDYNHVEDAWNEFHKTHNKHLQYQSPKEHVLRKSTFHQNFRYIQSKNRANLGYKLAVNHLADRTSDELKYLRGGRHSGASASDNGGDPFPYSPEYLLANKDKLPNQIDWRLYGAVTAVKDQAICGSCWSFANTGTIEGAYFLKHGNLLRFSQQALVDCSWGFGNYGCDGGSDASSYKWIMKHGGLPTEDAYGSYLAQDAYCHINNVTKTAKITGYVIVKQNELALKTALVKHGPISIFIDASHKSFAFYSNGVYYEPNCKSKPEDLDHVVLLVGYGVLNGKPYWLVKNSWSNHWGNDGYVLMSPKHNNCGVMTAASYVKM